MITCILYQVNKEEFTYPEIFKGLLLLKENKIFKAASLRLVSSVSVCVCTVTEKTIFNAENRCKFNGKHRLAIT